MNSEARYFKLGLFVIGGVALMVAGVVVFGAGALFQNVVTVETSTRESVEGLTVGGAVKYAGVTVGKVSGIEMASWRYRPNDSDKALQLRPYITIRMQIRREIIVAKTAAEMNRNLADAISRGMRVRMASSGLTGPAYLEVVYVDPKENPVPVLPFTPGNMYLPSAPSQMTEVVSSVEKVMRHLKEIDVEAVVGDVRKLINDADRSINDLQVAQLEQRAAGLLDDVRGSNRRIQEILANPKLDQAIDDASGAIKETRQILQGEQVKSFVADLPKMSAKLRDSAARVDEIVRDPKLQETIDNLALASESAGPAAADLRRVLRKLDVLVSTQSEDLETIVVSLRRLLDNGSSLVEDAKSNPARVLFGEPPPHIQPGGQR